MSPRARAAPAPQIAAPTLAVVYDAAAGATRITVGLPAGATLLDVARTSTATGHSAYVRGAVDRPVAGISTLVVYDYEAPIGVELVYTATATDAAAASSTATAAPITIADERDWLVDLARPTNSMPIIVQSLPSLRFEGPTGTHRVLERRDPVVTTSSLWTPTATLSFYTSTRAERDRARAILGAGVTVLLKTPPARGVGNLYLSVNELDEQRPSRLAEHDWRRFVVGTVQVARPDPTIFTPAPPLTYQRRLDLWATYRDVVALGVTYQELAYHPDAGGGPAAPGGLPWLPDDI